MPLERYNKKRNFSQTPEPQGTGQAGGNSLFMMHKHDARRLHYDLRLEHSGVLLSWAVTKGPSLNPKEKRLAVQVEDHPINYGNFEGVIPKGNYGAGNTLIFDRGYWVPIGDVDYGLKKGHLQFELYGQKLQGLWHLVRIASKGDAHEKNWLLIKASDEYASTKGDVTISKPLSVMTGRKIEVLRSRRISPELPLFFKPMLAKTTEKPPNTGDWLHEVKFDGYRMQVRLEGGLVRFFSRQGNEWTKDFLPLAKYFAMLPCFNAIIDGEITALNQEGKSDFALLQSSITKADAKFTYYAFDLLYYNDVDLRNKPLIERRSVLTKLFSHVKPPVILSEAFDEGGSLVLKHIAKFGLEGIVSKRKDSRYLSTRSDNWRKVRCINRQEFVVGGYTENESGAIASLLVGSFKGNDFIYHGRVGTGFSREVATQLLADLKHLKIKQNPFAQKLNNQDLRGVCFVKPSMVVEIEYLALTPEGRLRHASFKGFRMDKSAEEVQLEENKKQMEMPSLVKRTNVNFTHLDRIYWPERGVTKQNLVDYYDTNWPKISDYICNRPLSLLRCPDGIEGQQFFQKHAWTGMSDAIHVLEVHSENNLIYIDNLDGLLALAQSAVLEIHPWGAKIGDINKCDRLVMDIDPDEELKFSFVRDAAREIRDRFNELGLESWVKTSGGKGLHVVCDLPAPLSFDDAKTLTQYIANSMSKDNPSLYVAQAGKEKRVGKMFIDYQRNHFGATAVAAYSPRARPMAPISMPVPWDDLDNVKAGNFFLMPVSE